MNTSRVSALLVHLLSGVVCASLTGLLVYFKQNPLIHHAVTLCLTGAIFFIFFLIRKKITAIPYYIHVAGIIVFTGICMLGMQFAYQIRPYTFYITGFIIGLIGHLCLSANAISFNEKQRTFFVFPILWVFGYLTAFFPGPGWIWALSAGSMILILLFSRIAIQGKIISIAFYLIFLLVFWRYFEPIHLFTEQEQYEDKVVFSKETRFHQVVVTQWQDDYWFFIDRIKNLSSIDEYLFYEPMAHSAFSLNDNITSALILGGENGCLARELLKYEQLEKIILVSYDTTLLSLGIHNPYFISINQKALGAKKVHFPKQSLTDYLISTLEMFDAIFIDLPDPRSVETNQYYTHEFYKIVRSRLSDNGVLVVQAGSPYFATEAYYSIGKTLENAGFQTVPLHNQVLTLGEWGWYICTTDTKPEQMKRIIKSSEIRVATKWWNQEAAAMVLSFGKPYINMPDVEINRLDHPVVYRYYLQGNWDLN